MHLAIYTWALQVRHFYNIYFIILNTVKKIKFCEDVRDYSSPTDTPYLGNPQKKKNHRLWCEFTNGTKT